MAVVAPIRISKVVAVPREYRKLILNCDPSKDVEKDWAITNSIDGGVLTPPPQLPAAIDLRRDWWTVGNQGLTGSCVGWALADGVIRWHFVERKGALAPDQRLSTRYLWMAAKETDEFSDRPTTFIERSGTSLKAALDIARKYGVVLDEVLPFGSSALYTGAANDPNPEKTFYVQAAVRRIAMYINLAAEPSAPPTEQLDNWRRWLSSPEGGPLAMRLNLDDSWYSAETRAGSLNTYGQRLVGGGHAVVMVGYRDDGTFILRNSWGTGWGDRGFGYASGDYLRAAVTESYGIIT